MRINNTNNLFHDNLKQFSDIEQENPFNIFTNLSDTDALPITILTGKEIENILNGTYSGDKIEFWGQNKKTDTWNRVVHYKYNDCDTKNLVALDNGQKVHKKCKEAFEKMQNAAKKDGINIEVVSGYRSSKYQVSVFKKPSKLHGTEPQDLYERAIFSAPSGFSEHHTGLAIDINETEQTFENTPEYRWLSEHAKEYGFELSFPKNNSQGLGFEPWHYRYIGDEESAKIFSAARNS